MLREASGRRVRLEGILGLGTQKVRDRMVLRNLVPLSKLTQRRLGNQKHGRLNQADIHLATELGVSLRVLTGRVRVFCVTQVSCWLWLVSNPAWASSQGFWSLLANAGIRSGAGQCFVGKETKC